MMTFGIDRSSGTTITLRKHIEQSVADILTTPVGTRVQRREYGSHVFDLIDAPGNPATNLQTIAAIADALERWEPRITLKSATISNGFDGKAVIMINGIVKDDNTPVTYDVPLRGAA
tara:strand:+ start:55721 stop:56071 length:351 start_codon:yes stop_codon:yes gene_type:complete